MDKISEIIGDIKGDSKIKRIEYPYKSETAVAVWKGIAERYVREVKVNPDCKKAWSSIIKYCFADPKCTIDLNKGIGLVGRTGSGKTITMQILNDFVNLDPIKYYRGDDLIRMRFKFESAIHIAARYSQFGDVEIHKYSNFANLCIDDLGAENTEKKHFGNSVNVLQEVIENRYANGFQTHFTSNIKPEMIKDIYGDRVYSRLMDMVNVIEMNDCDFRVINNR